MFSSDTVVSPTKSLTETVVVSVLVFAFSETVTNGNEIEKVRLKITSTRTSKLLNFFILVSLPIMISFVN